MEAQELHLDLHGIQMNYMGVKELHFDSLRLPMSVKPEELTDTKFTISRSNYNRELKTIGVITKAELGTKIDDLHVRVELVAEFRVNEEVFPAEKVEEWASKAAHLVFFPYLREQIYALCSRVGMPPVLLPLFHIPTYNITAPQPKSEEADLVTTGGSISGN